jgi:hypothetical protein
MEPETKSPRTTVRRLPARGHYDRETIHAILDEALICHVGFVVDAQPYVIPTIHARVGETLYVHGSAASRMLTTLREGVPVCVTVSIIDGLVLARSAFHHSMNYRSVVVLATAREVTERDARLAALEAIVEHVAPGRLKDVRPPSDNELKATLVLELPLDEASAKVRSGPPLDEADDYALPYWAGVIPLQITAGPPLDDPKLAPGIMPPAELPGYARRVTRR